MPAGLAGAVSRTATAPIDRLKMLLQIQDGAQGLTLRGGLQKIAAEGERLQLHGVLPLSQVKDVAVYVHSSSLLQGGDQPRMQGPPPCPLSASGGCWALPASWAGLSS